MASRGEPGTADTEALRQANKELGHLPEARGWHGPPREDLGLLDSKVPRKTPRQRVSGWRAEGKSHVGLSATPGS